MKNLSTRQLVIDAMLCAVCAVLGYLSLDMTSIKITFESLPIFLGALLFGPVDGAAIGAVGTLIYQILRYGFSATTFLWMFPYILSGFIMGFYAKKRGFRLGKVELIVLVVLNELLITGLNTGVIYLDSVIYGYYYKGIILASLAIRLVTSIFKAVLFAVALPYIIGAVRRAVGTEAKQ